MGEEIVGMNVDLVAGLRPHGLHLSGKLEVALAHMPQEHKTYDNPKKLIL